MSRRAAGRGFTLVELMIVVAIVSVLVGAAYVYTREDPQPIDAAEITANFVSEGSQRAVAAGAVRANVVQALGVSARIKIAVEVGTPTILSMERLEENPDPNSTAAAWIEIRRVALPKQVVVTGWTATPTLSATSGPATPLASGASKDIYCEADGRCDGLMLYFRAARGSRKARVVLLPLGGTPVTFASW